LPKSRFFFERKIEKVELIEAITIQRPNYLNLDGNLDFNYNTDLSKLPIVYEPNSIDVYPHLNKYLIENPRFQTLQEEFKGLKTRYERIEFNRKLFNEGKQVFYNALVNVSLNFRKQVLLIKAKSIVNTVANG
jgi:hypothetical protein